MMTRTMTPYKKFFFRILILSALGWLILQLGVYFLCRPPEWYWINDIIQIKENIARNQPGPKIVFAGGSATLFGVRTADIQRELHIPTVNYGVHAGLGIDYILERAKKILKPGDTCIVPLEYNVLLTDGSLNEVRARYVLLFDSDYYNSLSFLNKINYFIKFSPITIELSIWSALWKMIGNINPIRGYDANALNRNGDETSNKGNDLAIKKFAEFKPMNIQQHEFRETFGLQTLDKFNQWCKENNIKLYVTYASTISFDVYKSKEYQEYFKKVENYFKQHDIKTIGSPNDFFYDKDYFYDTEYHLNSAGMTRHTEKLLSKIKNLFSDQAQN